MNISGDASAYATIYKGNKAVTKIDAGPIYAKLTVTVGTNRIEIPNQDGTTTIYFTTVKSGTPDSKGRSKYMGGGNYDSKASGVCGSFGDWTFEASDTYSYKP